MDRGGATMIKKARGGAEGVGVADDGKSHTLAGAESERQAASTPPAPCLRHALSLCGDYHLQGATPIRLSVF